MPDSSELIRKFFELALQQHQQRQHAFFRDLWIVGAVVLVFLLLILFRFVELDDRRLLVERALAQHEADQTALMELDTRLQILSASLDPITRLLDQTPDTLAAHIGEFDTLRFRTNAPDLEDCPPMTQSDCFPGASMTQSQFLDVTQAPPPVPVAQVPPPGEGNSATQSAPHPPTQRVPADTAPSAIASPRAGGPMMITAPPDPEICVSVLGSAGFAAATPARDAAPTDLAPPEAASGTALDQSDQLLAIHLAEALDRLPPDERQLLASTQFDSEEEVESVNQLIEQIVNEQIVFPHFQSLNKEKDTILATDFAAAEDAVCTVLAAHLGAWEDLDIIPRSLVQRLEDVKVGLANYVIAPPAFSSWWRTYTGKDATTSAIQEDVSALSAELGAVQADLTRPQQEIATLIAEVRGQQQQITTELATVEAEFENVRTSFQDYAKPLPVIPVELKFAVRYFPLLLALAIVVFVNRYRALRMGARRLVPLAAQQQLSPDIVRAYLGEAPGYDRGTAGESRQTSLGLLVLAIFAAALFLFTTKTIVESAGFTSDPPGLTSGAGWFLPLYQLAGVLILVAYLLLARDLLRQRPEPRDLGAGSPPTAHIAPSETKA